MGADALPRNQGPRGVAWSSLGPGHSSMPAMPPPSISEKLMARFRAPVIVKLFNFDHHSTRLSAEAECRKRRTHMVASFLGGHWSVVVPPVVSASPMRHWADATLDPGRFRPEILLYIY